MRHVLRCGLLTVALLAAPAASFAAQSTANMNVAITVTSGCAISVTDINFGGVQASAFTAAMTSTAAMGGLFTYICGASGTTPSLAAGAGLYSSGSNRMKGSLGGFLPYSLNVPAISSFTGSAQTAQVTATIPVPGALPAADTYNDAVVLTLSY